MKVDLLLFLSVSATHKETKQFFTLYNTLDDKKVYLEKEVRIRFCQEHGGGTPPDQLRGLRSPSAAAGPRSAASTVPLQSVRL